LADGRSARCGQQADAETRMRHRGEGEVVLLDFGDGTPERYVVGAWPRSMTM